MSSNRLLQTLILIMVFPLLTYAAAPRTRTRFKNRVSTNYSPAVLKKLNKPPDKPARIEKFIVKTIEILTPTQSDAIDSKADKEPEDARTTSGNSSIINQANPNIPVLPLFSSSTRQLTLIDKSYLDAYAILRERNSCSRFFGGPRPATGVLNYLYPRLKTTTLGENGIGIIMSGPITFGTDAQTGLSYRLFKEALVNLRGPFYQSVNSRSRGFFHKVGYYFANTREARVTMLLHELGHLLPDSKGGWLLPDDGGNYLQVAANTATIMERCSEQIKDLSLQRADATLP